MAKKIIKYKHPFIVILGPSAASGKDLIPSLVNKTLKINFVHSTTSRKSRKSREYKDTRICISKEKFEQMIKNKELFEYDFHLENYYGTKFESIIKTLKKGFAFKQMDIIAMKNIRTLKEYNYNPKNSTVTFEYKKVKHQFKIYFIGIYRENLLCYFKDYLKREGLNKNMFSRFVRLAKEHHIVKTKSDFPLFNPNNHPEKAAAELKRLIKKLDK